MVWRSRSGLQDFGLFVVTGMPIIASCFVALRYLSKHRTSGIAIEDHLLLVAAIFSIIIIYPSWRTIKMWNFGIHIYEVNPLNVYPDYEVVYKQQQIIFGIFQNPILPLAKASILIVLLKIGGFLWPIYISGWSLFAFNALACIIPEIFILFQCPITGWNKWAPRTFGGAHCIGTHAFGRLNIFQVSVSMFTDLLVFPIPIYLTWKLETLNFKTKLRVIFLFSLSLLVTILGGLRIWFTYQDRLQTYKQPVDWTWWNIRYVVQHAEGALAIIFACLPNLKFLFSGCCGGDRRSRLHDDMPNRISGLEEAEAEDESRARTWIRRMSGAQRAEDLKEIVNIDHVETRSRSSDPEKVLTNASHESRIALSTSGSAV